MLTLTAHSGRQFINFNSFIKKLYFSIMIKKRFLSMLVLLAAVATGAMAQTESLLTTITATAKEQASYSTANVVTVSFSYTAGGSSAYLANWGWWGYGWIATVTAAEGYTITKCMFYDDANRTATDSEAPFVVETTEEDKTPRINGTPIDGGNMWSKGIKKIEVYGYVTPTTNEGATGEYWATYYNATQGFTADANTTVFKAALTGSQLTMTEVANREIPAGKAVILKSTAASITLTPATTSATLEGNALQGTATEITNPGDAYVLSKGAKGVGFYKLSSTGTIGANKAYLTYSAGAREFFSIEGNVTGIEMPKAATTNSDAEVYDLQGRQVTNPTKGLYIVNGKKVFINK
jgi:hypothetical protein